MLLFSADTVCYDSSWLFYNLVVSVSLYIKHAILVMYVVHIISWSYLYVLVCSREFWIFYSMCESEVLSLVRLASIVYVQVSVFNHRDAYVLSAVSMYPCCMLQFPCCYFYCLCVYVLSSLCFKHGRAVLYCSMDCML